MASGRFDVPRDPQVSSRHAYSYCVWSSSKDNANNKSSVNVKVYVGKYSTSTEPTRCTMNTYVSVSGATEPNKSVEPGSIQWVYPNSEIKVFDQSFEVKHNDDGTKTISISVSIGNNGVYHASGSASNLSLDTIPRATDMPSFSSGYIEDTYTITLSPKISGATHSIKMVFGKLTNWLQSDGSLGSSEKKLSGKSLSITIPKTYYTQFNGPEADCTMYLYTYNGNTNVGSKSKGVKIYCSSSRCSPRLGGTVEDTNSKTIELTGNKNILIANASTALVTPTIQISDSDDTSAYVTSKKINNSAFTTATKSISKPTSNVFDLQVTNSRNLTTSKTLQATGGIIPYIELTFNIVDLFRPEPTTGEIRLKYDGKYYPGNFKENGENNTLTLIWEYKLTNSDDDFITGGELTPTINTSNKTYSGDVILGNEFDYTKGYTFRFTYKDSIIDKSITKPVPKGYPIFWWNEDAVYIIGDLYVEGQINPS